MEIIGGLIGWFFIFGFIIYVGLLINSFYTVRIYREIRDLNRHFQVGSLSPEKTPKEANIGRITNDDKLKYCSQCETGFRADRTSCPECSSTNFYLKN